MDRAINRVFNESRVSIISLLSFLFKDLQFPVKLSSLLGLRLVPGTWPLHVWDFAIFLHLGDCRYQATDAARVVGGDGAEQLVAVPLPKQPEWIG